MKKGFTFIELLVVIALIFILAAMAVPIGLGFYRGQVLDGVTQTLGSHLRSVQSQAMMSKNNSYWGIKLEADRYTIFQGSSFIERSPGKDEVFFLSPGISIVSPPSPPPTEIVFGKLSGRPNASLEIRIAFGGEERIIDINMIGRVEIK